MRGGIQIWGAGKFTPNLHIGVKLPYFVITFIMNTLESVIIGFVAGVMLAVFLQNK